MLRKFVLMLHIHVACLLILKTPPPHTPPKRKNVSFYGHILGFFLCFVLVFVLIELDERTSDIILYTNFYTNRTKFLSENIKTQMVTQTYIQLN